MKFKLPKLHNQILFALLMGAVFGSLFNVDKNKLEIVYTKNDLRSKTVIKDWEKIIFISKNAIAEFDGKSNQRIISYFKKLKSKDIDFSISSTNFTEAATGSRIDSASFFNISSLRREPTIAVEIKWLGDIFIRLLNMIAIPLVLASLIVGAASLGDIKKFTRIGGKTLAFYLVTTAVAITIGLVIANIIQPGLQMDSATKQDLMAAYQPDAKVKIKSEFEFDITQEIANIVPKNLFSALAESQMLQIVFFSVLTGLVLTMIDREKALPVISFFEGISEAMIKLVDIVMLIAPVCVFALIASTVGQFGFDILQTLFWYVVTVLLGLLIHTIGTYSLIIRFFTKMKAKFFFKGMRRAQTIAFSTSSSAATLPINMECVQKNLGVSKGITSFVLPLGATINMDGTALYQGVAAVFIAQVFGIELNLAQQLTIVLTATLASIGTAPVPGVGIIMLIIILKSVNIPEEGIALIIGVDRILDMCRTITNITGDAAVAVSIASSENEMITANI